MKREYVWISTKVIDDGRVATVMAHHKTAKQAEQFAATVECGGWEGPVPKDMYPIGKAWSLAEDAA